MYGMSFLLDIWTTFIVPNLKFLMNSNRRSFLKKNVLFGGGLLMANSLDAVAGITKAINTNQINKTQINVIYTNDILGNLDRVYGDFGGLPAVHHCINNEEHASLVFDAGGFLKPGADLATALKGIQVMNKINYHGVNLSAADLKGGYEHFLQLLPYMNFQLLSCNYIFENEQLSKAVKPYQVLSYGKYKIGVTGVGEMVNLEGLKAKDPQKALKVVAEQLKNDHHCDLIICLSHLSFNEKSDYNNKKLAQFSQYVDMVVGGNATLSKSQLWVVKNSQKHDVVLSNNYDKGLSLAKVSFSFNQTGEKTGLDFKRYVPGLTDRALMSQTLSVIKNRNNKNAESA